MPNKKVTATLQPNLGIYYDRAPLALAPRMLADGLNFRVKEGKLTNLNMGWERFGTFQLNGPVLLIEDFFTRNLGEFLVFATATDLYKYVSSTTVAYLTPRYETGTASRAGSVVTGAGGANFVTAAIKINDEISFGTAAVVDPNAVWHLITAVGATLTTATSGTVAAGPYTIRKKFSGTYTNIWQAATFINASPSSADELWLTNGLDNIVRWNGTSTQVEDMGATLNFKAKSIAVYSNMMIFGNLIQGGTAKPSDIINSNPGEPQNVISGLSEQFKVHGSVDEILRLQPIGNNLAIYSYTSHGIVTLAQFVGDPLVFAFRQVVNGTAPLGPKAIADFGNYHEFLAADSHYFFDGATVKQINEHFWREVLRQQDPARIKFSYTHFDLENGDLLWVIPLTSDPSSGTTGAPNIAETEHYLEQPGVGLPTPWSRRTFPFFSTGYFKRQQGLTWTALTDKWQNYNFRWNDRFFFAAFPLNLAGNDVGKVYSFNTVQNADGAALGSFVKFGRRVAGDARMRGLVTRVYPFVNTFVNNIQVTLSMADSANGLPMIIDTQNFNQTQPSGGHFTTHYRRGRFFDVQFSTNGPSQPWEVTGYDYDLRPGGKR